MKKMGHTDTETQRRVGDKETGRQGENPISPVLLVFLCASVSLCQNFFKGFH